MLLGKRCLVTGASRGIGEAIAVAFAKERASLLLVSRGGEALEAAASRCRVTGSPSCDVFAADLSVQSDVTKVANHALEKYGTIDVLVNNAGMIPPSGSPCLRGKPSEWHQALLVNVMAAMTLTHAVAPKMLAQQDGCIINIGSRAGTMAMGTASAYCATKFALRGWSLSCYQELRAHNVKVCLINPGVVHTDLISGYFDEEELNKAIRVEDVAEAALLPFRVSANCAPCEINLFVMQDAKVRT